MTKPVENGWPSSSLLRPIGYCLLVLALFDVIQLVFPPHFMDPNWEFQTIGALLERLPVPLMGLGLVFYAHADSRSKWERLPLMFFSWAALVAGVLFLLLAPLLVVDSLRLNDQIAVQVNTELNQQLFELTQLQNQVSKGTAKDINDALTRLNQGPPPELKTPQEMKSLLFSEITKAKQTVQSQADAAMKDRDLALFKNSVKWFLAAVISGILFIYIWHITRWARRGGKPSGL